MSLSRDIPRWMSQATGLFTKNQMRARAKLTDAKIARAISAIDRHHDAAETARLNVMTAQVLTPQA